MAWDLFRILFIVFLSLLMGIIYVKLFKKDITVEEATKICVDFLKLIFRELFGKEAPQEPKYNVYIGIDDYGNIIAQLVNKAFNDLHCFFETFYFRGCDNSNPHVIIYGFKYDYIKSDLETLDLLQLLQAKSEEILHHHFSHLGFYCNIPLENMVAVRMDDNLIYIYFAKDSTGARHIANFHIKIVEDFHRSKKINAPKKDLVEEWEEEKDSKGDDVQI